MVCVKFDDIAIFYRQSRFLQNHSAETHYRFISTINEIWNPKKLSVGVNVGAFSILTFK